MTGYCKYKCQTLVDDPERKNPKESDGTIHDYNRCLEIKAQKGIGKKAIQQSSTGSKQLDYGIKGEIEHIKFHIEGIEMAILALRSMVKTGLTGVAGEDYADKIEKLSDELAETQTALAFETRKNLVTKK